MKAEFRAAAIGGLAATFVVAAAFAPKLMSPEKSSAVRFEQTAAEAPVEETTTTTEAPTTTTTVAPTTTTTVAPTTTTTTAAPPTTTTTVAAPAALAAPETPATPATPPRAVNCGGLDTMSGQMICVVNPVGAYSNLPDAAFPHFKVRIRFITDNGPVEVVSDAPLNGGTFTVVVTPANNPHFDGVVAMEWDGGTAPNPTA